MQMVDKIRKLNAIIVPLIFFDVHFLMMSCGKFVANLWQICGKFVVNLWQICGKFVVNLWQACGKLVVNLL
jgi:putative Mn2+ efflux pump MntP